MYQLLILTSSIEGDVNTLKGQIEYLNEFQVSVTLCVDPTEMELLKVIKEHRFDCAYIHIKRRTFAVGENQFDPAKIFEQKGIPLLGNSYITQMLITDKYTTGKKSGIGLPNHLISRTELEQNCFDWEAIRDFPIIVKPNTLHASMGITDESVVNNHTQLKRVVEQLFNDFPFLSEVLIEKFVNDGQEYTVAVLGNGGSLAFSVTKLQYKTGVTTKINCKTQKERSLHDRSFDFCVEHDTKIRQRLEYHAKTLFHHFKMKDIARFDFILDKTYYLLEANTSPIPGNSFSWEWQEKYGVKKEQVIALFLCAFHFGQIASGKASRLPKSLIETLPQEIVSQINHPNAVDICPECSGPTDNCLNPHLFSMSDRVSSETEVHSFLNALTRILKPNYILETGTHKGNSTIAFAEGLRQNDFGFMTTIETDEALAQKAQLAFSEYPVEVINAHSLSYIPKEKIDFLFLDSKRDIRGEEFAHYRNYLNPKALIVWHDSSYREQNHSVYDTVEHLYEQGIIDRILFPTPRGLTLSMLRVGEQ